MSEEAIYDIEASSEVLASIVKKARSEGVECSQPAPAGDGGRPLHSPLSGAEIKEVLEISTLAFKDGTAALAFFAALRTFLAPFGNRGVARATERGTDEPMVLSPPSGSPQNGSTK